MGKNDCVNSFIYMCSHTYVSLLIEQKNFTCIYFVFKLLVQRQKKTKQKKHETLVSADNSFQQQLFCKVNTFVDRNFIS